VLVACTGFIVCLATANPAARYGASFIYVCGMYIANPLIMGYVSGVLGKTPEKRAVSVALCNLLSQIGKSRLPFSIFLSEPLADKTQETSPPHTCSSQARSLATSVRSLA
jgi:hypothetical protein